MDTGADAIFSEAGIEAMAPAIREMNADLLAHVRRYRASEREGLIAGHLTNSTLLGNAILRLDENPATTKEIRTDPDVIPQMVEEVLRYRSPLAGKARSTTATTRPKALRPNSPLASPTTVRGNQLTQQRPSWPWPIRRPRPFLFPDPGYSSCSRARRCSTSAAALS